MRFTPLIKHVEKGVLNTLGRSRGQFVVVILIPNISPRKTLNQLNQFLAAQCEPTDTLRRDATAHDCHWRSWRRSTLAIRFNEIAN